jgi:hypothetical protein
VGAPVTPGHRHRQAGRQHNKCRQLGPHKIPVCAAITRLRNTVVSLPAVQTLG